MTAFAAPSLIRSSPMRLAFGLVALFGVASLASLGGSYVITRASLEQTMKADLEQALAGFAAAPSAEALVKLVAAQALAADPERRLLSYTTPSGAAVGNTAIQWSTNGFQVLAVDEGETDGDGTYLALGADLYGGKLLIAHSRSQLSDLSEVFYNVLALSLLPTILIALGGGYALARRTSRRVQRISATLDQLTGGDLAARVPAFVGAVDDLTLIGQRIDRMAATQQASVSALRQVSTDIAHDLKTPIQRVLVLLGRLQDSETLTPQDADLVAQAKDETDRIVTTFASLLLIAQIEGGSPKSRFVPVDLAALAETFVEVYGPGAEDTGHQITFVNMKCGPVWVQGEKGLLGQVLANLIENALRHTPGGSQISVAVSQPGGRARLSVADNGPGIPPDQRHLVLRRLYRLEQSRTTPGNGLGLSLVDGIAGLHGADLALLDNAPGLRVDLTFPA